MSELVERLKAKEPLINHWTDKGEADACWQWKGSKFKNGYGRVYLSRTVAIPASRAVMMLRYGHIPSDIEVCHKCDNRICVNPAHLFLGTAKDNAIDKAGKGRCHAMPGTKNPSAKLTEAEVLAIRSSSKGHAEAARMYAVSESLVRMIRNKQVWKHV